MIGDANIAKGVRHQNAPGFCAQFRGELIATAMGVVLGLLACTLVDRGIQRPVLAAAISDERVASAHPAQPYPGGVPYAHSTATIVRH
jgi:hypothetical protein